MYVLLESYATHENRAYKILDTMDMAVETIDKPTLNGILDANPDIKILGLARTEDGKIGISGTLLSKTFDWNHKPSYNTRHDGYGKFYHVGRPDGRNRLRYSIYKKGLDEELFNIDMEKEHDGMTVMLLNVHDFTCEAGYEVIVVDFSYCDKHYYREDREEDFSRNLVYINGLQLLDTGWEMSDKLYLRGINWNTGSCENIISTRKEELDLTTMKVKKVGK